MNPSSISFNFPVVRPALPGGAATCHRLARSALLVAAAFPCIALAEPTVILDSVVVSGSNVEHSSFDLPAAVDVVDAAKISADQARVNASEALSAVPGIVVQNRQNYAQDLQISSRGFGARTAFGVRGIRLVADGIPVSMPDGQGQAATFNLDRAERIEVMRGPMSAIYGNHAGGVIQLFTPDGSGAPSVEGNFSAGSFGSWKADLASQGAFGPVGYLIDASRFGSEGYREHSTVERDQTLAKLTASLSANDKLTFVANGFRQQAQDPLGLTWNTYRTNPSGVESNALLYNTRKSIDQQQGGLNYEHRYGDSSIQVSAYAGQRSVVQYQSIPTFVQANPKHSGGVIDFDRSYAGVSGRWIGRFQLAGGKLTTTAGLEYEQSVDDRRGYENFIGSTLGVKGKLRRKEEDSVDSFGQYLQAEWQGDRLGVSGGLRHSRIAFKVNDQYIATGNGDDSGNVSYEKTTPVLSAIYRITPTANLYASAARGFETPTLNELFYSGTGGTFSFDLKPATSTHLETGLKAMIGDDTRLDVALFQVRTNNELVVSSSSGGRTSYRNAGRTLRRGIEIGLDTAWQGGFTGRLAYTNLRAVYDESFLSGSTTIDAGNRLPGVPRSQLYGELAWKHTPSGFHTAVEVVARDKVYVEDTNTQQAAPAYAIANLRFGLEGNSGPWKLKSYLRVDNIFDRQYVGSVVVGDSNGRYYESAPGRSWLAGVSARYAF